MTRAWAKRLRYRLWYFRNYPRLLAMSDRNFEELVRINRQFASLLADHHAVGALDGALVGDECPVCTKAGLPHPERLARA